jgi:hypothetical protein
MLEIHSTAGYQVIPDDLIYLRKAIEDGRYRRGVCQVQ